MTNKTVCLGSEWYRFPSHFFVPKDTRISFIKSDFNGLLPQYFRDGLDATSIIPSGFNDENKSNGKYEDLKSCDYLIGMENVDRDWEPVTGTCRKFLDSGNSGVWRLFYVPFTETYKVYRDYCLYKRVY